MFGFLRERRARTIAAQVCPDVAEGIKMLSPVDRAAVLAIVNAMLEVAAETWGPSVDKGPQSLGKNEIADLVCKLADKHARLLKELVEPLSDRGMEDVTFAQAMREVRACEVVIATFGGRLLQGRQTATTEAWKLLWAARGEASEAGQTLMRYMRHAGADPLPRSKRRRGPPREDDVVRLAGRLPLFFQRKRRSVKAAGSRT